MRAVLQVTALIFCLAAAQAPARAAFLTETLSGSFGPTTTLGNVALGADTAFTLQATADTSSVRAFRPGLDIYAITRLTITIAGEGTFAGISDADTNIFLTDLTLDKDEPFCQVGIVNSSVTKGFGGAFAIATPAYNAGAPISSNLAGFLFSSVQPLYEISLVGVAGGLVVSDVGSAAQTATIQVSVPEPASLAMLGIGLFGMLGYGWQRRSSAGV